MKTSKVGIDFIIAHEGLGDGNQKTNILEPYQDHVGLWTLGYGARYDKNGKEVTASTPAITEPDARKLLQRDLGTAEDAVAKYITIPITQGQVDALVSFTYNCGAGTLQKSALCKKINAGGTIVETDFTPYSKARLNGKLVTLPVLVKRRKEEAQLYIKG